MASCHVHIVLLVTMEENEIWSVVYPLSLGKEERVGNSAGL
jgi:hypothetical protein